MKTILNRKMPVWSMSISLRAVASVLAMLVGFGASVWFFVHSFEEDIYVSRKRGLEDIVSLARNSLSAVLADRNNGKVTIGDARISATEIINQLVYYNEGVTNYVFLSTYEGYILVEQPSSEEVGTYQMQRKDIYGNSITKLLLERAKSGGGFVEYYEAKAPGAKAQKKIAYVIGLPEIECYLGTGVYVDDIEQSVNQLMQELLLLGCTIVLLILLFQYYLFLPLFRCQRWLADVFKHLSQNPGTVSSVQIPASFKNADTDQLLENLHLMLSNFSNHQQIIEKHIEKFRRIAFATTDVIWEWNAESNTTEWSGNIKKLIGYEPSGAGVHFEICEDWVYQDDRKKRRQALASYFSGKDEFYTAIYRLYDSAAHKYNWVWAKGIGTFDKGSNPTRFVGAIITLPEQVEYNQRALESRQEQASIELTSYQNIKNIIQLIPSYSADALVIDVKKRLDHEQWQGIAVVEDEKPIGLVMRDTLNFKLSSQYGVSLYYGRPISAIMDRQPLVVDADAFVEHVAKLAQKRPEAKQYDLVVVTEHEKYLGIVSVIDLLASITDLRITLATNANPLTGLPGNRMIQEKLRQAVQRNFAALYIDLDNFKAYNDKYGFEMGDRAIQLTAAIIKEIAADYDETDAFLGHIGGDDFLVLVYNTDYAMKWIKRIIAEFDARIPSLYLQGDLERGHIIVLDRKGEKQQFPIMGISIALVDNQTRQFTDYLEISEVAAQLKKRAKMVEGSTWVRLGG